MSFDNAGYGAGGGAIGVLLSYLGFKQRLDRMQVEIDAKVACPTCNATIETVKTSIEAVKEQHKSIDEKLNIIIEHVVRK